MAAAAFWPGVNLLENVSPHIVFGSLGLGRAGLGRDYRKLSL